LGAEAPASSLALAGRSGRRPPFSKARSACAECHDGPHGGQFAARAGGDGCDACHGTDAFLPASRFDHDRDAGFRLDGAHERVACARCHPSAPDGAGRERVTYRPVDSRCESCHAAGGRP
jgi:hypothetical protein